jgi:hypothetical protein
MRKDDSAITLSRGRQFYLHPLKTQVMMSVVSSLRSTEQHLISSEWFNSNGRVSMNAELGHLTMMHQPQIACCVK